ncbi:hypothetical protein ALC56_10580 [Trachymyrmex septentrionalis]|uniref:DUF8207 domain-containing protein n=1 Tax=Trachymyrmex septentrionalis TaxID=34720 RepID=A0A195F3F4_9HYME|nr:hypothetical protein ALC56_10580 [Trachymyrmex septentrionalis]
MKERDVTRRNWKRRKSVKLNTEDILAIRQLYGIKKTTTTTTTQSPTLITEITTHKPEYVDLCILQYMDMVLVLHYRYFVNNMIYMVDLNKHFKPLIEPLRLFVDNPGVRATKRDSRDEDAASAPKREKGGRGTRRERRLQTSEGREALRAGLSPFGSKVEAVLRGAQDKESGIDHVYGVYLHKDGLMFGNKRFDVDDADNIIVDGVRYAGTLSLYELIFKRIPNDTLYMKNDMHKICTRTCCW